ncbi:2'-5' RNA ligase family protein [bacterium AH-315-P15]|nr:2'-5' RNA ligase family protein [bacterium AH-315-P15]MBN4046495.1 2'-5' RNA ligase family protein [bacterium AH-315-P15]
MLPIPELEKHIGRWRKTCDPAAMMGVPPHITLTFPFHPWKGCDDPGLKALKDIARAQPPIDLTFEGLGSFPGTLYFWPEPADVLVDLIERIHSAYPGYPPYRGAFEHVIPHLTVGDRLNPEQSKCLCGEIMETLAPQMPLHARATKIQLLESDGSVWSERAAWRLGTG